MKAIPSTIEDYVHAQLREACHPLCLVLDPKLCLRSWSGDPGYYGIGPLEVGVEATSLLPLLPETLDAATRPARVPLLWEITDGRCAYVHLIPSDGNWAVLLLDATEQQERQRERQQSANQLELLQQDQARLLDQLRQAHAALEKKNRDLDRANRAKSSFIANMSHEFRTPLTSVLGYSRLLRETLPPSHQAASYVDAVERGGRHLLTLVDNLLDEAGIEAGEVEIRPVPTNLERMFRELLDLIRPLTRDKALALELDFTQALPNHVLIDELRLRQILINLLGNAAKFTRAGSVRVQAQWHWDLLSVAVVDTGPGVPLEASSRIFDAFQRGTGRDQTPQKGTGLGLAISRELAQRMGGDLTLESSGPGGSCFRVSVPAPACSEPSVPPTLEQTWLTEAAAGAVAKPASIVVAEDDPDIRALMELYLEPTSYRVRFAEDGLQAVQTILDQPPDLVLMDMQMPKMDGISAVQKLRQDGFDKLIVALTGASSVTGLDQAVLAGCDHCLGKPLDMEQLLATIEQLLARPQPSQSPCDEC